MPDRAPLSVVMAVAGDSPLFRESLRSVLASDYPGTEVTVVDDSPAGAGLRGLPPGVRAVRTSGRAGPAAARNAGARACARPLLAFIDSDVVLSPDTLSRLEEHMRGAGASGAIAVQSAAMRFENFSSAYKNIFMRYSFARIEGEAPSFYTCCAMVTREAFLHAGGFDEGYARPSVEDTDMGHRLAGAGARVVVGRGIEVEHVKRYSARALLGLDFMRAAGLARMLLRRPRRAGGDPLSVPGGFITGAFLSTAMLASGIVWAIRPWWAAATVCAASYAGLLAGNAGFLGSLARHAGPRTAALAALFLPIELLVSVAGALWGLVTFAAGRRY